MVQYPVGILMAMLAYTSVSVGIVLQKKGIHWMGWREEKNRDYYRFLFLWAAGFLIMNIYGIPSAVALKTLPPHIVSSFAGWGIIVLVVLSRFFLNEKIYSSDFYWSLAVISGIVLLNLSEKGPHENMTQGSVLAFIFYGAPLVLFLAVKALRFSAKTENVLYAIVSGCSAGAMVVALKGIVSEFGFRLSEYPASVFLYIYIFFALMSFLALQLSLRSGPAFITGQFQYSMTIVYPLAGTVAVFSGKAGPGHLVSIALIIAGITGILKKR